MKKILIIGCCGAGKSTLARQLGEQLKLPIIHLDQEYWLPSWTESDAVSWDKKVTELVNRPTWIMDGNYGGTLSYRFLYADTIIWLDPPTWLCMYQTIGRVIKNYGQVRPDMAPGCPERFSLEFMHYILTFKHRKNPRIRALLAKHPDKQSYVLQSRKEVKEFLAGITMP